MTAPLTPRLRHPGLLGFVRPWSAFDRTFPDLVLPTSSVLPCKCVYLGVNMLTIQGLVSTACGLESGVHLGQHGQLCVS